MYERVYSTKATDRRSGDLSGNQIAECSIFQIDNGFAIAE